MIDIVEVEVISELLESGWGKEPVLLTSVARTDILTDEVIMQCLRQQASLVNRNLNAEVSIYDAKAICISAIKHSERANSGIQRLLPLEDEFSLDQYTSRLLSLPGFNPFSIIVDTPHLNNLPIWMALRSVSKQLRKVLPSFSDSITADAFIGNYSETPFGRHRDKVHNLMFMVSGERTIHFWPSDPISGQQPIETEKKSFNVKPGDLLYWPPAYWHVGENHGMSVSLNVNCLPGGDERSWVEQSVVDAIAKQTTALRRFSFPKLPSVTINDTGLIRNDVPSQDINDFAAHTSEAISTQIIAAELIRNKLEVLSAFGLQTPIPTLPLNDDFSDEDEFCALPSNIFFSQLNHRIFLACNGHNFLETIASDQMPMLEQIVSGEAISVTSLATKFPDADIKRIRRIVVWLCQSRGFKQS